MRHGLISRRNEIIPQVSLKPRVNPKLKIQSVYLCSVVLDSVGVKFFLKVEKIIEEFASNQNGQEEPRTK